MPFIEIIIYIGLFFALYFGVLIFITLLENKKFLYEKQGVLNFPLVSFLLPCYNEETEIEEAVQSIADIDYPKDKIEIIIIDDGSTDKTLEKAQAFTQKDQRVIVLRKENGGKHTALNLAIPQAKGDFIATLDADCRPAKNALREMLKYFQAPDVAAVTACIKVHKPQNMLENIQHIEFLTASFLRKIYSFLGAINMTPGPLTVFRKNVFTTIGLYHKAHLTEDCEIAFRMQKNHLRILHAMEASVYTKGQKTFKSLFRQRLRWYRGFVLNLKDYLMLLNVKKHGNLAVLLVFSLAGAALSIFLALISVYKLFKIAIHYINNGILINFDFSPLLNFKNISAYFVIPKPLVLLSIIALGTLAGYILLGKRLTFDKIKIKKNIVIYFILYSFFNASWWILTGLAIVSGKEIKWK